jgi:hypothetical protein
MTGAQVVGLVIFGAIVLTLFKGKKKPPGMLIIETFEVFHAPRRRTPVWLVNMAVVAGIALFIWIMNR